MLNDPAKESETESIVIRCYFVRERNALLVRSQFTPIYTDYYLHLMQHQIRYESDQDLLLKDAMAALTLYLATRPWNEAVAWTLSWQDPALNLFVTGSNRQGNVTGRIYTEDIAERDNNMFFSHVSADGQPSRQSMVEVNDLNPFLICEDYYKQSEQRRGRFFNFGDEDFVLITAQPDCDLKWLESLDDEAIRELDMNETLSLIEKRNYRFHCGCSPEKIFPVIANMSEGSIDSIFGKSEIIPAGCPRCGAKYSITREALEAFVKRDEDEESE